jgi:hypothetical protein
MVEWVAGKSEYTEEEAAAALGLSIGELRSLVRKQVINEDLGADIPITSFRPTDLLLLEMLSESGAAAARPIGNAS